MVSQIATEGSHMATIIEQLEKRKPAGRRRRRAAQSTPLAGGQTATEQSTDAQVRPVDRLHEDAQLTASAAEVASRSERRRWIALAVLCLGQLMMVLDSTIVNVALPSIQHDLGFSQGNLTWVIDGYLITFGGFLLLAGRLGDLVGRKRVFLSGLVLFTAASVLCGIADSQGLLIGARLLQGVGGAVASSVILAIIVTEFPETRRAGQSDGAVRVRLRRRRLDRAARRWRADAVARLALDLLRQRADRHRRLRARLAADRGERGHRPRAAASTGSAPC